MNESVVELKPTNKQIELLRSKGVTEEELQSLTRKGASSKINEIFQAENQGQNHEERTRRTMADLLVVSDEIMQHLNISEVYVSLSEGSKVGVFGSIVEAYTRMSFPRYTRRVEKPPSAAKG